MTEIYKFFNSAPGDERWHYASDFADYFGKVLSTGLLHKDGTPNLQVKVKSGTLQTYVEPGEALMQGYQYQNTQDLYLTHSIPEPDLDRIDRIVLRLDKRNSSRYIKLFVKEGVSAVNPVAPALQRDNYIHEISLAQIRLTKNTATLNPLFLVDERMQESLCGIVYSLISVPTSVFQQQWDNWFNIGKYSFAEELNKWMDDEKASFTLWQEGQKSDFVAWRDGEEALYQSWLQGRKDNFDEWFATIRGILGEEAAGNIMNVINDHKDSPVPHKYYDEGLAQPMIYGLQRNATLDTPAFVYGATESGPLTTINLPNYQQVEDIKNVVETTGGVVVDIHDKRYKSIVSRPYDFVTGDTNVDALALINEDYKARFPEVASKLDLSAGNPKLHIRDGIFLAISSKHLTFFDMETNKILNAMELKDNNFWATFGNQWFEDDKYIYIRGQNGALNTFALGVFDRLTFQFIKGILYTGGGGLSLTYNSVYPGDLVLNEDIMRVGISGSPGIIYSYRIIKDSGGVPTSIMGVGTPTQLANASVRTIFKYKEFVYAISAANTTSFTLQKFSISTPGALTMTEVAKVSVSSSSVGQESKWKALYTLPDGTDWAIVSFGSSQSIQVLNLTLMQNPQFIANAAADTVVAYDSKNKIVYWQESSVGASGMVYNGIRFEPFYISTLDQKTGYWKNKVCYIRSGMTSYNASSYTRTAILGDYAIAYGGKLLFRYGYKNSCELIEEYINEGLKEV
ncbi:hypothetical protein FH508_0008705 [Lysinibacillus sp. CD3-6]|uniref:hypothetical protein n=1 Tax=Lysinibacillus sp. CD3-6 TaxID=2892541 RepID=UPI001174E5DD|nr:hypothetical protein [Lysinibacillus sp. CD3-6]UED81959.1 hypothetical protein FH508_0008705 [Lysinibacillus sp. CD3-6]